MTNATIFLTTTPIDRYADTLDSRDIIARIEDLLAHQNDLNADEQHELDALLSLEEDAEDSPDWRYGVTLVNDRYFVAYTQEIAEENVRADALNRWPYTCIDWEQAAQELQHDYISCTYQGQTFWICA